MDCEKAVPCVNCTRRAENLTPAEQHRTAVVFLDDDRTYFNLSRRFAEPISGMPTTSSYSFEGHVDSFSELEGAVAECEGPVEAGGIRGLLGRLGLIKTVMVCGAVNKKLIKEITVEAMPSVDERIAKQFGVKDARDLIKRRR